MIHHHGAGIDTVHYQLLKHLPEDSLLLLLYIFNHIWLTQVFPLHGRPVLLYLFLSLLRCFQTLVVTGLLPFTSCLCKTMERMVNSRLTWYLERHMPSIERKLQQSLNRLGRWCDENGFKFSPTKTVCSFWSTCLKTPV